MLTLIDLISFFPGALQGIKGTYFNIQTDGEGALPGWGQAVGDKIKGIR